MLQVMRKTSISFAHSHICRVLLIHLRVFARKFSTGLPRANGDGTSSSRAADSTTMPGNKHGHPLQIQANVLAFHSEY
jgi:hypothetical protein